TIQFDQPIPCSQLVPGNFNFTGPAGGAISSVTPVNCVNGFATSAVLGFASPLSQSGTYSFVFTFNFIDICGNVYRFQIGQQFRIINCPLQVQIVGSTDVCTGFCTNLTAVVQGGNPSNYQFTWSPNVGNTAVVRVCPSAAQTYTVTVTDGSSQPASASHSVNLLPVPDAGVNQALCRFAPDLTLVGTPAGGNWVGPGITNGANGTFRPSNAGAGNHYVYYVSPNGCYDSTLITVHPVSAGGTVAACTGSAPFNLTGTPGGGTWSGSHVSPAGQFTPTVAGSFTLTYTEPNNGCTATRVVNVVDSVKINGPDTISVCDKQAAFQFTAAPGSGRWTGVGITNQNNGTFDPATAGQGTYKIAYAINGCSDTVVVVVNTIDAGTDALFCPLTTADTLRGGSPISGIWSGTGVIDSGNGTYLFDPQSVTANNTYTLTYSFNGCTDTKLMYVYYTQVRNQPLSFCEYDLPFYLDDAITQPNFGGGVWSGNGVRNGDTVDPAALGPGTHYIYYEFNNNGCIDSLPIVITSKPNAGPDITTCPAAQNFNLIGTPAGGTWSGPGIVDANTGEFSPAQAGFGAEGDFQVIYSAGGCSDTAIVSLKKTDAKIVGTRSYYCQDNSTYALNGIPTGGTFTGMGVTGSTFNPTQAGTGDHPIIYTVGTGDCIERDTVVIKVLSPIQFSFVYNNAKLCFGDSVRIDIAVSGGDSTQIRHYRWIPDKGDRPFNYIRPTQPTTFQLTVEDGCSTPVTQTAFIDVYPEITYTSAVGDTVCFGQNTWGKVEVQTAPQNDFQVTWFTSPPTIGDSIYTTAAKYRVEILNTVSQCKVLTDVRLPAYQFINARILQTPQTPCVTIDNPKFEFINLTSGADRGYWSFGDGDTLPYHPELNPVHVYPDTGEYRLRLFVTNEGGCRDSIELDLCVEPIQQYLFPNAFTPDESGYNDVFPPGEYVNGQYIPKGYGIVSYEMQIFDRWGSLLYETDRVGTPWNGRLFNTGEMQKSGVYVYAIKVYFGPRDIKEVSGRVTLLR
ncbi:MAG TPA: gliding motility-associated C-terminal domain-containing protein, partial [Luteibaculaceae bacterium]|nr:gliding motility-associated C-terminal domain-containing protein [Luteibaculaceae bacterium]